MLVAITPNAFMALPRRQGGCMARHKFMRGHGHHSPSKERRVEAKSGMLSSKPRAEVAMVPGRPRVARSRDSMRASEAAASAAGGGAAGTGAAAGAGADRGARGRMVFVELFRRRQAGPRGGLETHVGPVEKHRANLMEKLDLHNVAALTALAAEKGLINR